MKTLLRRAYHIQKSPAAKVLALDKPVPLQLGGSLKRVEVAYETFGDPKNPAVLVIPALSAGSHLRSSARDPRPGWWEQSVGPGRAIDPGQFFVVCPSILGGPFGTTCPLHVDEESGEPYGMHFPQITPADQADVHMALVRALGIPQLRAVVGSSLGGMQVLEMLARHPGCAERAWVMVSTGRTSPATVALRRIQRLCIMQDPDFQDGQYSEQRGPWTGLNMARQLATLMYRSRDEFDERFSWNHFVDMPHWRVQSFEVEKYMDHAGNKFARAFDPLCYLTLSRCMDLMNLGRDCLSYEEGVKRIQDRLHLVAVDRDVLIPPQELKGLYDILAASGGCHVTYDVLESKFGHDAFLVEHDWLRPRLAAFLR